MFSPKNQQKWIHEWIHCLYIHKTHFQHQQQKYVRNCMYVVMYIEILSSAIVHGKTCGKNIK